MSFLKDKLRNDLKVEHGENVYAIKDRLIKMCKEMKVSARWLTRCSICGFCAFEERRAHCG